MHMAQYHFLEIMSNGWYKYHIRSWSVQEWIHAFNFSTLDLIIGQIYPLSSRGNNKIEQTN